MGQHSSARSLRARMMVGATATAAGLLLASPAAIALAGPGDPSGGGTTDTAGGSSGPKLNLGQVPTFCFFNCT